MVFILAPLWLASSVKFRAIYAVVLHVDLGNETDLVEESRVDNCELSDQTFLTTFSIDL